MKYSERLAVNYQQSTPHLNAWSKYRVNKSLVNSLVIIIFISIILVGFFVALKDGLYKFQFTQHVEQHQLSFHSSQRHKPDLIAPQNAQLHMQTLVDIRMHNTLRNAKPNNTNQHNVTETTGTK